MKSFFNTAFLLIVFISHGVPAAPVIYPVFYSDDSELLEEKPDVVFQEESGPVESIESLEDQLSESNWFDGEG